MADVAGEIAGSGHSALCLRLMPDKLEPGERTAFLKAMDLLEAELRAQKPER